METPDPQDARSRLVGRGIGFAALTSLACTMMCPSLGVASDGSDWRRSEPFSSAATAVEAWLAEPEAVAHWRDSVGKIDRASRAGQGLLRAAEYAGRGVDSLIRVQAEEPPEWLTSGGPASESVRLAVAESLALARRYDECLAWSEGVDPELVYSPELLHYVRALAFNRTVQDESAFKELERLQDRIADQGEAPLGTARWWVVQTLFAEMGDKAEPGPLSTVTRRMDDVHRRLSLDEAGEATQEQQRKILEELDKLIEELEEQRRQQQQQQAAGGASGGAEPGSPAEQSLPGELKGPGEVDRKRLVAGDAWGGLPPAERERLTQAITRDFPPHYRALVEDYFRTLADEADTTETSSEGR